LVAREPDPGAGFKSNHGRRLIAATRFGEGYGRDLRGFLAEFALELAGAGTAKAISRNQTALEFHREVSARG